MAGMAVAQKNGREDLLKAAGGTQWQLGELTKIVQSIYAPKPSIPLGHVEKGRVLRASG